MEIAYKIRSELIDYVSFIKLAASLTPPKIGGGVMTPLIKEVINTAIEFANRADEAEFIIRGPGILNALERPLNSYLLHFPLKKSLGEVAAAFREISKDYETLLSYGIPFSWLDTYIDTSDIVDGYTPYQAKIGIGHHAGKYSLEESTLLSDGFYFLASAKDLLAGLLRLKLEARNNESNGYVNEDFYQKSLKVNLNTCSLSRNAIVNLYSFVECFVNSVGYDYFLRNKDVLSLPEQHTLKGHTKNGGFISLEYKLEKFPLIINRKSKQIIHVLDIAQRKAPFSQFLDECKEIRDAAMHYSPLKHSIWRKPVEWVDKAELYSKLAVEVARVFWLACYPHESFPRYLLDLDYKSCYDDGEARCKSTSAVA
jgi:hypothetical protein